MAEVRAVAEEKKHRLTEIIDWARRGHWIWTLFPAGWKAYIVGAVVAGITAILALIRRTPLPLLLIYSLLAVLIYVIGWVIVQKLAPRPKEKKPPKPSDPSKLFFSLEALNGEIHASDPAGTPYLFIRNCGQRTARNVRFDSIRSKIRGLKIWIDGISSLAPLERVPLGFHAGEGEGGDYQGTAGHLIAFFEGGSSNLDTRSYPVTIRFLDGIDELTERHIFEGTPLRKGGIRIKIVPAI